MTGRIAAVAFAALVLAVILTGSSLTSAQSFESYRCDDGTRFIVGFYQYDSRAFLQLDGKSITLRKRLTLSGARYSGGGVTLSITSSGTTIRHVQRPVTTCQLI